MVVGADVTHPDPGSQGQKPSIAAVCASVDPEVGLFNTEVRLQDADQSVEEIIKLREMMSSLLLKFYQRNKGRKPEKIIFYRDGVSEGQFDMVLVKASNILNEKFTVSLVYIIFALFRKSALSNGHALTWNLVTSRPLLLWLLKNVSDFSHH